MTKSLYETAICWRLKREEELRTGRPLSIWTRKRRKDRIDYTAVKNMCHDLMFARVDTNSNRSFDNGFTRRCPLRVRLCVFESFNNS